MVFARPVSSVSLTGIGFFSRRLDAAAPANNQAEETSLCTALQQMTRFAASRPDYQQPVCIIEMPEDLLLAKKLEQLRESLTENGGIQIYFANEAPPEILANENVSRLTVVTGQFGSKLVLQAPGAEPQNIPMLAGIRAASDCTRELQRRLLCLDSRLSEVRKIGQEFQVARSGLGPVMKPDLPTFQPK